MQSKMECTKINLLNAMNLNGSREIDSWSNRWSNHWIPAIGIDDWCPNDGGSMNFGRRLLERQHCVDSLFLIEVGNLAMKVNWRRSVVVGHYR